jgi:hypothetical protein
VRDEPGWELCAPRHVLARLLPREGADEENEAILERVNASGEIFISHTKLDGRYVLRLAIGNDARPRTTCAVPGTSYVTLASSATVPRRPRPAPTSRSRAGGRCLRPGDHRGCHDPVISTRAAQPDVRAARGDDHRVPARMSASRNSVSWNELPPRMSPTAS